MNKQLSRDSVYTSHYRHNLLKAQVARNVKKPFMMSRTENCGVLIYFLFVVMLNANLYCLEHVEQSIVYWLGLEVHRL